MSTGIRRSTFISFSARGRFLSINVGASHGGEKIINIERPNCPSKKRACYSIRKKQSTLCTRLLCSCISLSCLAPKCRLEAEILGPTPPNKSRKLLNSNTRTSIPATQSPTSMQFSVECRSSSGVAVSWDLWFLLYLLICQLPG